MSNIRRPRVSRRRCGCRRSTRCPGSDFTVKCAARRSAARSGHLLPLHRGRSPRQQQRFRADRRPLPHRAACAARSVRFVWSGDTAGQGWGIDDVGMKTYSTMKLHEPDFFIHSGDTIYADNPMPDEITAAGRDGLEEPHRHAGEARGRPHAGRISRPVEIQSARRACPRPERRLSDLLSVGRPRGAEQLVGIDRPSRRSALSGKGRLDSMRRAPCGPFRR